MKEANIFSEIWEAAGGLEERSKPKKKKKKRKTLAAEEQVYIEIKEIPSMMSKDRPKRIIL